MKEQMDTLIHLEQLALDLIRATALEKAGVRDGALLPSHWTDDGHCFWRAPDPVLSLANEIAQVAGELRGIAPTNPKGKEGIDCLILAGCHEFGTESYAGRVKFYRDPKDNVQVAIPTGMKWNAAVGSLRKVLDDLEFWISTRTDTTIEDLDIITERKFDSPFPPF